MKLRRAVFVLASLVLFSSSAFASTYTVDDTLANNHVSISWSIAGLIGAPTLSANCSAVGVWTATDGQADCLEDGSPNVWTADIGGFTVFAPSGAASLNFWDDHVGGIISDVGSFVQTVTGPTTTHLVNMFQSGPGVVAIPGAANWLESQGPLRTTTWVTTGHDPLVSTFITSVPEPGTLVLLGSALVLAWRRARA